MWPTHIWLRWRAMSATGAIAEEAARKLLESNVDRPSILASLLRAEDPRVRRLAASDAAWTPEERLPLALSRDAAVAQGALERGELLTFDGQLAVAQNGDAAALSAMARLPGLPPPVVLAVCLRGDAKAIVELTARGTLSALQLDVAVSLVEKGGPDLLAALVCAFPSLTTPVLIRTRLSTWVPAERERVLNSVVNDSVEPDAVTGEWSWAPAVRVLLRLCAAARRADRDQVVVELLRAAVTNEWPGRAEALIALTEGTLPRGFLPTGKAILPVVLARVDPADAESLLIGASASLKPAFAAHAPLSEGTLTTLAKDGDWKVRRAVCENPGTPLAILTYLALDSTAVEDTVYEDIDEEVSTTSGSCSIKSDYSSSAMIQPSWETTTIETVRVTIPRSVTLFPVREAAMAALGRREPRL